MLENKYSNQGFVSKVFMMLAITLIPTVIGLLVGLNVMPEYIYSVAKLGILFPILIFAGVFILSRVISKSADTTKGFILLLLLNFLIGLFLSVSIYIYLQTPSGIETIQTALISTIIIFIIMGALGATTKMDLSKLGTFLLVGVIAFFVAIFINLFIGSTMMSLILSVIGTIIFSLYILYDMNRIVNGHETSVIRATLNMYLNIINLFINLLNLIGLSKN